MGKYLKKSFFSVPVKTVSIESSPIDANPVMMIDRVAQSFRCIPDSNAAPSPSCVWYKGDTALSITALQTDIAVAKGDNINSIKCECSNNATNRPHPSATKSVQVLYGPVLQALSSQSVIEGQRLSMRCVVKEANPAVTNYSWTKNEQTVASIATLELSAMSRNQMGVYSCTASNRMNPTNGAIAVGRGTQSMNVDVLFPPLLQTFTHINVKENDPLSIECKIISANPMPSNSQYSWTKINGGAFPTQSGKTLHISRVQRGDSGTYRCTARNTMVQTNGTAVEGSDAESVIVNVQYSPSGSPVLSPTSASFNETQRAEFTCRLSSDGNPRAVWSWSCDGRVIQNGEVDNTTPGQSTLRITVAASNNGRVCRCFAASQTFNYNETDSVTLDVKYAPKGVPVLTVSATSYTENDAMRMRCDLTDYGNPAVVWGWSCAGMMVPTDSNGGTSLITTPAKRQYNGQRCTCRATSPYGLYDQSAISSLLNVTYPPSGNPVLLINPSSQSYEDQSTATLTCLLGDSNPLPTLTWRCLDKDLTTGVSSISNSSTAISRLILTLDKTFNGRECQCKATHFVGPFSSQAKKIFDVLFSAGIKSTQISGSLHTVAEGTRVNITSEIEGNPNPDTFWKMEETGQIVQSSNNVAKQTSLIFEKADCLNTSMYNITVQNSRGSDSKTISLNVTCKPRSADTKYVQHIQSVGDDKNLSISLLIIANPKPIVTWYRLGNGTNETLHKSDTVFFQVKDKGIVEYMSEFRRSSMQPEDFGKYQMVLQNSFGTYNITYTVTSERVPDPPTNLIVSCPSGNVQVFWQSGFNGLDKNGKQEFYILFKKKGETHFMSTPTSVPDKGIGKNITGTVNLTPADWVFKVQARNTKGNSNSTEERCKVEEENSQSAMLGVIAGSLAAVVVIAAVVVAVILFRRVQKKKKGDQEGNGMPLTPKNQEFEGGIKDNILYVSAGPSLPSSTNGPTDMYAEVVKKPKGKKQEQNVSDVYAEVQKPVKKGKKAKGAKDKKQIVQGDVYENVEGFANQAAASDEAVYSNNSIKEERGTRNQDGLLYVEVDLRPVPEERRNVIIGEEERTDYASVDFILPNPEAEK